jgi:phytanoyl-CoA hydroxylase
MADRIPVHPDAPGAFQRDGFVVARSLFKNQEVATFIDHFMALRARQAWPGDMVPMDPESPDPLRRYPRMVHMHRWDPLSMRWMIDRRLQAWLSALTGEPPFAVQTMLYFKPPGARGQALHQDQYYLRVRPGRCMAAWLALDDTDEENGCMQVVPGSHTLPLLCTKEADLSRSFTDVEVQTPDGMLTVPVEMTAGDVLFFDGLLIHGSFPNTSATRFRRSLIAHYVTADSRQIKDFFHPVHRMDGTVVDFGDSDDGGPCGVWAEHEGEYHVEMTNNHPGPGP